MRGVGLAVVFFSLLLLLPTLAQARIRMLDASDVQIPLAAGSSATLTFTLRNDATTTASVQLGFSGAPTAGHWTVVAESACPLPVGFLTETISLAGAGQLACQYRLTRLAGTGEDQQFFFYVYENDTAVQNRRFLAGDLTQLQVQTRILRYASGGQRARASVEVRNLGPTAVGALSYGRCVYPGDTPVTVVGGDCQNGSPVGCFTGGGATGFSISALAVGASKSCVLEWAGSGSQTTFELALVELHKAVPAGAGLLNSNRAAEQIMVSGAPVVTQLPTNNTWALVLLLAGIALLTAVTRMRCR